MSSCAVASSTRACAVCSACFAESKIARVVKPRSIRWFWRSKLFCASTSWPRAALSAACAERSVVELVLRIELRQHLIRLDLVADLALPLDDPSADAEGEVHLVFGADVPGERDRFADLALFDGDGADRARLRRLGLGFLIAAGHEQRERGGDDERTSASARTRFTGARGQGAVLPRAVRRCAYRATANGATIAEIARRAVSAHRRASLPSGTAACYCADAVEKSSSDPMRAPDVSHSSAESEIGRREPHREGLILDPRDGDAEDDASSPKQKSLLAIAGSLLAEISLTKLILAWLVSIVLPAAILGLAPLIVTAWAAGVFARVLELTGIGAALVLLAVVLAGWFGWRPLFRIAEANFWALNALGVQPGYALCREAIRHLMERAFKPTGGAELARMRAMSCAGAGILLAAVAALVAALVWPATRWIGSGSDLAVPHQLIWPTLANAIVIMSAYLAAASLVWGFADASMDQPLDLEAFDATPAGARIWRVAHLSDIHIVGERYGFRIESGRGGPRGNERLKRVVARLEAEHAARPLDLILITGDMTDAGRSAEWAEFFDILAGHPDLAGRMLILPGNHDVNVVDRSNPARLDLPFSPAKTLRKVRALSAIAAFGADRLRVMSPGAAKPGLTLAAALKPQRQAIETFADQGGLRLSNRLARLWDELFPLILPPAEDDGLGVALLNSNADTNFSFTNALGMISVGQARRLTAALDRLPQGPMDRRAAPSFDRVSDARRRLLRADRHRPCQRQLVSAHPQALCRARRRHAWPPSCRLDRRLRQAQGRLGPVAGDGAELRADAFLYPCARVRAGRAPGADGAGADRPRRCRGGKRRERLGAREQLSPIPKDLQETEIMEKA